MKKYCVLTKCCGEYGLEIKNTRELAELWESDNECGYLDELKAYEYINGKMTEVNVYEIAREYLNERDEIQKEYEEYTEYVNEYGHEPYYDEI